MSGPPFPVPRHFTDQNIDGGEHNRYWANSQPPSFPPNDSFFAPPSNQGPFGYSSDWQSTPPYFSGQQPPSFPVPQHFPDPRLPPSNPYESDRNYTLSHGPPYPPTNYHSGSFPNVPRTLPDLPYPPLVPHTQDTGAAWPYTNNPTHPQQWPLQNTYTQQNVLQRSSSQIYHQTPPLYSLSNTDHQTSPPYSSLNTHHQPPPLYSPSNRQRGPPQGLGNTSQWSTNLPQNYTFNTNPTRPGRKRGLCIGINYEGQGDRQLRGAVNDSIAVRDFLVDRGGYNISDIVLMNDHSNDPDMLPTKENIIMHLQRLTIGAQPNDSLFFHYSGHGGLTKDLNGDERRQFSLRSMSLQDGMDSVIYTLDGQEIIDDTLHDIMVKPLPKGCRLTALFDACHSGTALDLPYVYKYKGHLDFLNRLDSFRQTTRLKRSSADVVSWSSCRDNESSADTFAGNTPVGAMSNAFIQSLTENPNQSYEGLLKSVETGKRSNSTTPTVRKLSQDYHERTFRILGVSDEGFRRNSLVVVHFSKFEWTSKLGVGGDVMDSRWILVKFRYSTST